MPRLRTIERTKYHFDNEELELLDSEDQKLLVNNFKDKLGNEKPRKWALKSIQFFILALGSIFIIHPYYRHDANSIMSTFACFILWAQVGQLYSVCNLSDQMSDLIRQMFKSVTLKRLRYLIYFYFLIFTLKWWCFWTSTLDWIYLIPGLLGILIVDQEQSKRNLLHDINKLDKLKYDFKQA